MRNEKLTALVEREPVIRTWANDFRATKTDWGTHCEPTESKRAG